MSTADDLKKESEKAFEEFLIDSFSRWLTICKINGQTEPTNFESYIYGLAEGLNISANSVDTRRKFILDWAVNVDIDKIYEIINKKVNTPNENNENAEKK